MFPVIIKNKKGKIVQKISAEQLKKKHWENFDKDTRRIKTEKEMIFIKKQIDQIYPSTSFF